MAKHKIEYKKAGTPNSGSMTPFCSCGWKGTTWSNQHPNQFECVVEQGKAHLKEIPSGDLCNK